MGSHFSKEDSELSPRVQKVTHACIFGGAGIVALGWYLGNEDNDATLALKMARWGGFGLLLGGQVWNSFVSGVVLITTQPMHTFGDIQASMIPAYFNYSLVLSATSMGLHLYLHPTSAWSQCERMLMKAAATTFITSFINMTFIFEPTLKVMRQMFAIEREVGIGQQIGRPDAKQRAILDKDPNYCEMRSKFGRLHGISSLLNMAGLGGSIMQLVYLSQHGP